jgi:hypothetical protein
MLSAEEIDAITQPARDHIEAHYTSDGERMRQCLHPDLVKRTVVPDARQGKWQLYRTTDAQMLVEFTQEGDGSGVPESEQTYQIMILDVFRHIACVKVVSYEYVDYLQLAKLDQHWLIVNVLWELREGELEPDP